MDWKAIKAEAKQAGEQARMVRYAHDESDDPEPRGAVHLLLSGAGAASALAAREARQLKDGVVRLEPSWENPGAISYARAWSEGVAAVLRAHGVACALVEEVDRSRCDDGSLRRGLAQLPYLGVLGVSCEAGHPGRLRLSQHKGGPVVLELSADEVAASEAYLAAAEASGLPVRRGPAGARVRLGVTVDEVAVAVVQAMTATSGTAPLVLLAHPGSGHFPEW